MQIAIASQFYQHGHPWQPFCTDNCCTTKCKYLVEKEVKVDNEIIKKKVFCFDKKTWRVEASL
eukprot:7605160-Alexandrium_andersonii.AAC.1